MKLLVLLAVLPFLVSCDTVEITEPDTLVPEDVVIIGGKPNPPPIAWPRHWNVRYIPNWDHIRDLTERVSAEMANGATIERQYIGWWPEPPRPENGYAWVVYLRRANGIYSTYVWYSAYDPIVRFREAE